MIIQENRTELDLALHDPKTTILLLCGPKNSPCGKVHQLSGEYEWEPWRHIFLITNPSILSVDENNSWFGGIATDRYAVVGGGSYPKQIGPMDDVNNLFRQDGKPSILKIRNAFAAGDQL